MFFLYRKIFPARAPHFRDSVQTLISIEKLKRISYKMAYKRGKLFSEQEYSGGGIK